jgi:hypothetical protein
VRIYVLVGDLGCREMIVKPLLKIPGSWQSAKLFQHRFNVYVEPESGHARKVKADKTETSK